MKIGQFGKTLLAIFAGYTVLVGSASIRADETAKPAERVLNVGGINDPVGGTIQGVVKFVGRAVPRRPIQTSGDKYCETMHKDSPALDERWVFGDKIGSDGTALENVLVYVSKGLEGKTFPVPGTPAEIAQYGCVYHPHVLGVVAGQELKITNDDNTLHNVKANPQLNPAFNEGMPVQGMVITKKFAKPETPIVLKCDVHAWMTAYVHVLDNPFFAVTQKDGTFTIKGLPPGEYEVSVWHEFPRFQPDKKTLSVTVKGGQTVADVDFTFRPPAPKG